MEGEGLRFDVYSREGRCLVGGSFSVHAKSTIRNLIEGLAILLVCAKTCI